MLSETEEETAVFLEEEVEIEEETEVCLETALETVVETEVFPDTVVEMVLSYETVLVVQGLVLHAVFRVRRRQFVEHDCLNPM